MSHQVMIAKTVAEQIGGRRLGALGATKKIALRATDKIRGGLQFSASLYGKKQCKVVVELMPADTYRVSLIKPRTLVVVSKADDIYADEVGPLVESMVEHFFAN